VNIWPVICGLVETIIMNAKWVYGGGKNMWPVMCGMMEVITINAQLVYTSVFHICHIIDCLCVRKCVGFL
jgi:hypothetical protein